jgi:hypothetical protein
MIVGGLLMMGSSRAHRWWWFLLVAATCQGRPLVVDEPVPPPDDDARPAAGTAQALTASGGCVAARAGQGWMTRALPRQTGPFAFDFNVTPAASQTDAVFGLVAGQPHSYADVAAMVRFAPNGVIDVRNGGAYAADTIFPYAAGTEYHVHLAVDVGRHLYSVWVTAPSKPPVLLAAGFAFRSEQAGVAALDGYAAFLDPAAAGGFTACGAVVGPSEVVPGCTHATPGAGFLTRDLPSQTRAFVIELDATPGASPTDAVVGLVSGSASSYAGLATSVRFANTGQIDVRRGGAYAAATALPYAAGKTYHIKMAVDVAAHTYSVWAGLRGSAPVQLAASYAFRSEQASVPALNGYATEVDPDGTGTLDVCGFVVGSDPACSDLSPGSGWASRSAEPQSGRFLAEVDAAVDPGTDAVVGFSSGPANSADSLAIGGHFNPMLIGGNPYGFVEMINGAGYSALSEMHTGPRANGYFYRFLFDVDLGSHTYSAWVSPLLVGPFSMANHYAFRPAQGQTLALAMAGGLVAGSTGGMTVCRAFIGHEGQPLFVGLSENFAQLAATRGAPGVASRSGQTVFLDPRTAQVIARWPVGGLFASNQYIVDRFLGTSIGDGASTYLARFDATTGALRAKQRLASTASAVKATSEFVAVATPEGVQAFNTPDLTPAWRGSSPAPKDLAIDTGETVYAIGDLASAAAYLDRWSPDGAAMGHVVMTADQQLHLTRVATSVERGGASVAGIFAGSADLACGGQRYNSPGSNPIGFVVRYDADGTCLGVTLLPQLSAVTALAQNSLGEVVVAGTGAGGGAIGKIVSVHSAQGWWRSGSDTGVDGGLGVVGDLVLDGVGHTYALISTSQSDPLVPHLAIYAP